VGKEPWIDPPESGARTTARSGFETLRAERPTLLAGHAGVIPANEGVG
jgi:hypothetical protein